jgi:hypothetical protein
MARNDRINCVLNNRKQSFGKLEGRPSLMKMHDPQPPAVPQSQPAGSFAAVLSSLHRTTSSDRVYFVALWPRWLPLVVTIQNTGLSSYVPNLWFPEH